MGKIRRKVRLSTRFGTYGFLSLMLAAQMSAISLAGEDTTVGKIDRARVNNKENTRSEHSDLKKTVRKVTGKESKRKDVQDRVSDARKDANDEVQYGKRKADRTR